MKPLLWEGLQAAMNRLPEYHESIPALQTKQATVQAGFGGEQELDKIFERYPFSMEYQVFHDLSLFTSTPFQLDTLFITPWYAIVFEVKNMSGELLVTENPPQLIRTLESGQVSRFKSPITQLENNCALFTEWLVRRGVSLPVHGVIVLAYPRQHIEVFDTNVPILFPQAVPAFIRKLPTGVPLLKKAVFADLLANLQRSHRQFIPPPICTTFSIPAAHIQTGVICPHCNRLGMKKNIREAGDVLPVERKVGTPTNKPYGSGSSYSAAPCAIKTADTSFMSNVNKQLIDYLPPWNSRKKAPIEIGHIACDLIRTSALDRALFWWAGKWGGWNWESRW